MYGHITTFDAARLTALSNAKTVTPQSFAQWPPFDKLRLIKPTKGSLTLSCVYGSNRFTGLNTILGTVTGYFFCNHSAQYITASHLALIGSSLCRQAITRFAFTLPATIAGQMTVSKPIGTLPVNNGAFSSCAMWLYH
jgi:hypothetical protein